MNSLYETVANKFGNRALLYFGVDNLFKA